MEIEFQNTKIDYKNFYKLHFKNELKKRIAPIIIFVLLIGISSSGQHFELIRFLLGVVISAALFLSLFYLLLYWFPLRRQNKAISKDSGYLETKKISTSEEGLSFESSIKNGTWKWESIVSFQSNQQFIYIILSDKRFFLIPKRAFSSESDATNFLGIVQNAIFKVKGNSFSFKSRRPPYLLGILCLIPLIGAFVGIGLILYGIFEYKDKWLVIIGAAGLAITISVYSYLGYQLKYDTSVGNGFAQISQMELNTLMKDVEFYKMQNGVYPDSLEQVTKNDQTVIIYDPLQTRKNKNNDLKYNYEKAGTKYYLFSSGIDGIPNTSDDIYPTIANGDSSKFGLIRKQVY